MSCCFSSHTNGTSVAEPNPSKHVYFNVGMVIGVDDLNQEFAYLSGRDQWLARDLIGYGTVRGLNVRMEVDATKGPRVVVEPGVALSPRGQLICVPAAQCAYLKNWVADHSQELTTELGSPPESNVQLYVVLCYRHCPTDNVPIAGEPCRSEDKLMAPSRLADDFSLELRLEKPNQREENAVRDFVVWLKQIQVSDSQPSTPLDQFLQAIRDAAGVWLTSPLSSPPGDFMFGSPPGSLIINAADAAEYLRTAFGVWVTELRPKWIARWHGCAAAHIEGDKAGDEDCVLLAELDVPVLPISPGAFDVPNQPIPVNQQERPYLVHLRLLQEWLMADLATTSGPVQQQPAALRMTNLTGPTTLDVTNEECIICDSNAGIVRINLPLTTAQDGRLLIIKRISAGALVQIFPSGAEQIDTQPLPLAVSGPGRFFQLVANAQRGAWHVVAQL